MFIQNVRHIHTFGNIGYETFGTMGTRMIDTFLVGTQLSFCCVYFTYVAANIHAILPLE